MKALYDVIWEYAKKQAGNDNIDIYYLLYGYAKVMLMDPIVVQAMTEIDTEEFEKQISELLTTMEKKNLDVTLIQEGMPLLLLMKQCLKAKVNMEAYEVPGNPSDSHLEKRMLERLLEEAIPELHVFSKGNTLDDIFKLIEDGGAKKGGEDNTSKPLKPVKCPEPEKKSEAKKEDDERVARLFGTKKKEERSPLPPLSEILGTTPEKKKETSEKEEKDEKISGFAGLVGITRKLYDEVGEQVKGQDEAIRKFVQGYFESAVVRSQEEGNKRPQATFLFAGPPGVGKTFMAEMVAKPLGYIYKRFDMSEYSTEYSNLDFAGYGSNYKKPSKGLVTGFVDENPKCILLFDEIEKAHRNVIYLFLQILEGGVVADNCLNKKISFKDTILIFTTNVGKKLYEDGKHKNLSALSNEVILSGLKEEKKDDGTAAFPPEICSRFATGNIIMFNHLPMHHLAAIVQKKFDACVKMIRNEYDIEMELDDKLPFVFLYHQSGGADGRIASSKSTSMLKQELFELGRTLQDEGLNRLKNIKKIKVVVGEYEKDVAHLFVNKEECCILVLSDKQTNEEEIPRKNFNLVYTNGKEEMFELLKKHDFEMVLIDPMYGMEEQEISFLSQGDIQSVGMNCLIDLREKMPAMPVMVIGNQSMNKQDVDSFLQMGVRGIIDVDKNDGIRVSDLYQRIEETYFQKCAKELAERGRILEYSTAQYFSPDGESAIIRYYGFHTCVAVYGDSEKKMLSVDRRPKDRFADVIGAENAKGELQYFIKYLQNPKNFMAEGMERPKGVLLYGPPGTGKTMLARAMAGESNVTFLPATAAGFIDRYVGEGERKISELFATARKYAPAIIFIDEIDAIAKERTGEGETEAMLNTLLTEMDGFDVDPERPVFVLAATNFGLEKGDEGKNNALDPALLRRFSNRIYVDLPNEEERKKYLNLMLTKKKRIHLISEKVIQNIAERTTGQSLAVLQNIIDLAIRNSIKEEMPFDDTYLINALEEYQHGEEHKWDEDVYRRVAFHEAGHAYLNWLSGEIPSFVTIVSRGDFGGYMQHANSEKTLVHTKENLINRIRTCLAGRASEIVNLGEKEGISTGISGDLRQATNIAMRMISYFGMMENQLYSIEPELMLKSSMAGQFLEQVNALLNQQMEETIRLVKEGNDKISRLAEVLIKKNQIVGAEIDAIFRE